MPPENAPMKDTRASTARSGGLTPILVFGFGTTVAMWAIAYLCRLPFVQAHGAVLGIGVLVALVAGGFRAGRETGAWATGLGAGVVAAFLNFLILGSLLSAPDAKNTLVPSAALWIPGFLVASALLCGAGGLVGSRAPRPASGDPAWPARFARVTAAATLLLVVAGGLVTGEEAGMDVPDWPASYGYNMFLLPITRMTGGGSEGIYFEHTHRLFGTLVGLASLVLAGILLAKEKRRFVKGLGLLAFGVVVSQGILGGLRVTENNTVLAAVHGVFGQVIFALILVIAAITSATWKGPAEPVPTPRARTDRRLAFTLVVLSVLQITLGALVRHFDDLVTKEATGEMVRKYGGFLHGHYAGALLVLIFGILLGFRIWGPNAGRPVLPRLGLALIGVTALQVAFGFAALIVVGASEGMADRPASDVLVTTLHQATGAILLALAALSGAWCHRLLEPSPAT